MRGAGLESAHPPPQSGAAARGEATFDGTLSVGSVRLRAGMPLTELSPQLPQLSEELAQLAQDLQSSSQGRALLDSLAAAATDAAKAGSELYATAADTASPVLQQAATEGIMERTARSTMQTTSPPRSPSKSDTRAPPPRPRTTGTARTSAARTPCRRTSCDPSP